MVLGNRDINCIDFYTRLKEERERCAITQKELGRNLWMDQTLYSRIENGYNRLSFYELQALCKTQIDVWYVFSGKRHKGNEIKEIDNANFDKLVLFIRVFNSLALSKRQGDKSWSDIYLATAYISAFDTDPDNKNNIIRSIRYCYKYKQSEMAKILGCDIKKLRQLELDRTQPDNEVLFNLYKQFGLSPALMLQDEKGLRNEIYTIIDNAICVVQETLVAYIEFISNH